MVYYKYFPYGGLQRDSVQIAEALHQRGHEVEVFTMKWQGEIPSFLKINIVPAKGFLNFRRYERFSEMMRKATQEKHFDSVIGFNKMAGLDIYYAADPCFATAAAEKYPKIYRLSPRYRHFYNAEAAVFSKESKTKTFLIAPNEQKNFEAQYGTPADRFFYLPPGVKRDRMRPENADEIRAAKRASLGIKDDEYLILMIGSGFKTKGLDRALLAVNSLPEEIRKKTKFMVMGQDNPNYFLRLTKKLNLQQQVTIFKGRDDVPEFLLAADLLIHPAYRENAGVVLLESICSGLPVLTTSVCGYAHYVEEAQAGKVLPLPFSQQSLNDNLLVMLKDAMARLKWSRNGVNYSLNNDLYSLAPRAAEIIENIARELNESK
jgi:UDP-glucose:(heptosyl)LPS alpha-1,3-glucosyltransferase